MSLWAYWVIAALIALIVEIFTGTVYLLVISSAALGAALGVWLFDGSPAHAWLIASILALIGTIWVYHHRQKNKKLEAKQDAQNNDLDVGEMVHLQERLSQSLWRVSYRGSIWEAEYTHPSAQIGDMAMIVAKKGNVLKLQAPK